MPLDALATPNILSNTFDYTFDSSIIPENGVQTVLKESQTSPPEQFTALTSSSLDSGTGLEFDQDMQLDRRASSEEKDVMTPAQSRRKAQNRAA